MTNNPTIDGLSRDALGAGFYTTESGGGKYAINIGFRSMVDMQDADQQLRELLRSRHSATPVVEQQEPVAWVVTDMNGDFYFASDRRAPSDEALYKAPPQLAELQAEIEQLKLELEGQSNVRRQLAELVGVSDEPRWKWILLEVGNLQVTIERQAALLRRWLNGGDDQTSTAKTILRHETVAILNGEKQ